MKWWSPMSVVFTISHIESLDLNIRKRALKMRMVVQQYSDAIDDM